MFKKLLFLSTISFVNQLPAVFQASNAMVIASNSGMGVAMLDRLEKEISVLKKRNQIVKTSSCEAQINKLEEKKVLVKKLCGFFQGWDILSIPQDQHCLVIEYFNALLMKIDEIDKLISNNSHLVLSAQLDAVKTPQTLLPTKPKVPQLTLKKQNEIKMAAIAKLYKAKK